MTKGPAYVYVMACEGRTKIGMTSNIQARRRSVETAAGVPVALLGEKKYPTKQAAGEAERSLHRVFAETRLHGEWFALAPEVALEALASLPDVDAPPPPPLPTPSPDDDEQLLMESTLNRLACIARGEKDPRPARTACSRVVRGVRL